jgi:bifunctional enzyme CysN/CysC
LFFDPYDRNRSTGGFVLIDPNDFRTVGAGMIRHSSRSTISELKRQSRESGMQPLPPADAIQWTPGLVALADRIAAQQHKPLCVWLYGATIDTRQDVASQIEKRLFDQGIQAVRLTDANTRDGLNGDLREQVADAKEAARRHIHLARMLTDFGHVVICAFDDATIGCEPLKSRFVENTLLTVALDTQTPQAKMATFTADAADAASCANELTTAIMERIR